jgi:hypothetical protein
MLFGSHSATRAPALTPAARNPAAALSTRSWKPRQSNVPVVSVTAGAAALRADHANRAGSVRGYCAP